MKRTSIFGIVIAAALAVIAAIAPRWRPHRSPVTQPAAPVVPADVAPPPAPKMSPTVVPAVPSAPPPVVVAPFAPVPETTSEEPATPTERPDLMREERNQEKAVDLFADKTLQLEDRFSDDPNADEAHETRALHQFRNRDEDADARDLERIVGDDLREWMAAFPPDVADSLVLVSVECRVGACRILLAQLFFDMAHHTHALGATAIDTLFASALWQQEFVGHDLAIETVVDQPGSTIGHALVTIYVPRRSGS